MVAYYGGMRLTDARWLSTGSLLARFVSLYAGRYMQLYAGRTLIGVTSSVLEVSLQGTLQASRYPQYLALLAVEPADRLKDFGGELPRRPYNRADITWLTSGWASAGAVLSEITGSTTPGGAVDPDNLIDRVPFDVDRRYELRTPALDGTGRWSFSVSGVDGTLPNGNRGPVGNISAEILATPPDVILQDDGARMTVDVAAGVAHIAFSVET